MLARVHLVLGLVSAVPIFFWALSGLLYSLPGQVEGSTYAVVDGAAVRVGAAQALALAARPVSALTLQNRDGRTEWDAVAGADELRIDAQTGAVERVVAAPLTPFRRTGAPMGRGVFHRGEGALGGACRVREPMMGTDCSA